MHSEEAPGGEAASGGGRSKTALPAPAEILERQDRLAGYRAAWRALAPLVGAAEANAGRSCAREIHERLKTIDDQLQSAQAWPLGAEAAAREAEALGHALGRLDADLDRYAALLCNHLRGTPRNRLRAHLYAIDPAQHLSGIAPLVDFILGFDPDLETHATLVELLVTLLATAEQGGRRRVVRDPATLTPTLRSHSERAAANSDLDLSKVEQEFVDASRRCESGVSDELLREMNARATELGSAILAPQALRSLVFFNAASWNDGRGDEGCGPSGSAPDPGGSDISDALAADVARDFESRPDGETAAPGRSTHQDPESDPNRPSGPTGTVPPAGDAPDVSEVQWRIESPAEAPPIRKPQPDPDTRTPVGRLAVAAGGLAAALLLAAYVWWSASPGTVQVLSEVDLRAISSQLDSGYRSGFGSGPLFVGTVGSEWAMLSSAERKRNALEIVSHLSESGTREALVYDESRRIALHFAEGLPLRIEP